MALILIGSVDEFDRGSEMSSVWPGLTLNLCGQLAPRESAAVMKRAVLFVGHDSGPMHLASAVGVPCVGLFGNFNRPKWWHPIGERHRILHCKCRVFEQFSPEEVYAAVCSSLAAATSISRGPDLSAPSQARQRLLR